jgi:hypothetical protein
MPQRQFDWQERIKAVEREYLSARIAVKRLSAEVARDPTVLGDGPKPRDLKAADEKLEGTYLIRMFAEFETGVRSYWRTIKPRALIQAEVLLNRVGAKRGIPADVIRVAHKARKYRNNLTHDHQQQAEIVTTSEARSCFATYFARLPIVWAD